MSRVSLIRSAAGRRARLEAEGTTAYRVLDGAADQAKDVTVDRLGEVAVISFYRPFTEEEERRWVDDVAEALRPAALYLKRRPREARNEANLRREEVAPSTPAFGREVPECDARENGLAFRIRPGQGLSVGLYLDMRATRSWVRAQARGRAVLNLFAYTCGFAVAALAGGARRVLNVDLSRRVLDWGKENLALNGLAADAGDFVATDALGWLGRAAKRDERFELVVVDPPSFATTARRTFSADRDYGALAQAAARVVSPGGSLVACCNLAKLPVERFKQKVGAGLVAAGRRDRPVKTLFASPVDFPGAAAQQALKVVVYEP